MTDRKPQDYRRITIGIISVVLLSLAVGLHLAVGNRQDQTSFYIGICTRLGLVLGSIWLAWPQVCRIASLTPKVVLVGLGLLLLVGVVFSKKLFPIALLFIVAAIALQLVARLIRSLSR